CRTRRSALARSLLAGFALLQPQAWAAPGRAAAAKSAHPTSRASAPINRAAPDYLGTPATERAVERSLRFLSRTQNPDGSWDSSSYMAEVGISGLCCLAF